MPEKPLYQGARPNLGEGIHPLAIPTTGLQAAEESNKRFSSALDSASNRFFQLQDFGQQQKLEGQIREETAKFDREFLRRANLAPGATGSLYMQDGRLNENALDDLVFEYSGRIEQIHRHFINPEKAIEAEALRSENIERLKTRAFGQAAQQEITNVRRNFEDNLRLSLTTRDYPGAISSIDRAVDDGLITSTNAEARKQGIRHDATWENAQILLATDPDELNRQLDDGTFNGTLSPLEQENLRRELAREGEQRKAAYLQNAHRKGASGAKRKPSELVGYLTKKQHTWLQAVQSGDGANYKRAITAGAIEEAACAPMNLSPEKWEAWRARYLAVYTELGMSKDFLNRQLQEAEERNKTLAYPSLPVKDILDRAERDGHLLNPQQAEQLRKQYDDSEKWKKGGDFRNKHPYNKEDSQETAFGKFIQQQLLPQHAAELHATIFTQFNAWRTYNEEGQKADLVAQQEKLQSIIRDVTGNQQYRLVARTKGITREVETARALQYNKYLTYIRRNPQNVLISPPEQAPEHNASIGYDTDPGKPFGILIPKRMADDINLQHASITFTYDDDGTCATLPIVGTCEGDSPMMTKAVADEFYANPKETRRARWRANAGGSSSTSPLNYTTDDGLAPEEPAYPDEEYEEDVPVSDSGLIPGTGGDPIANHNEPLPL